LTVASVIWIFRAIVLLESPSIRQHKTSFCRLDNLGTPDSSNIYPKPRHRRAAPVPGLLCRRAAADVSVGRSGLTRTIGYGLLVPIFVRCVDDQGHPPLGPARKGPAGKAFLREAYTDIPAVVEAVRHVWTASGWQGKICTSRR
jgi:hypothetical protein